MGDLVYVCLDCDARFTSVSHLHQHQAGPHCTGRRTVYLCENCGCRFTSFDYRREHKLAFSDCFDYDRRQQITKEKMKEYGIMPVQTNANGVGIDRMDSAEMVFAQLAGFFSSPKISNSKVTKEFLTEKFSQWSTAMHNRDTRGVHMAYVEWQPEIETVLHVIHNGKKVSSYEVEVVNTNVRISGMTSPEQAQSVISQIKANPSTWGIY